MPKTRNYSERQKRDAMDLLDIYDDIAFVHQRTGVHQRTLRRWRKKLRQRQNCALSEKEFVLSENRTMPDNVLTSSQLSENSEVTVDDLNPPEPTANADPAQTGHSPDDDSKDFAFIRARLMTFARQLAADLHPDDPDTNLRTLSLTRILDRIQWLDTMLPDKNPGQKVRFEHYYDGKIQEHPPWHGVSEGKPRMSLEDLIPRPLDPELVSRPHDDYDESAPESADF